MQELEILTLNDNKNYVIVKTLEYNTKKYFLLIEIDEEENLLNQKIILEQITIDDNIMFKTINNNYIYQIISEKFAKLLLEDIK